MHQEELGTYHAADPINLKWPVFPGVPEVFKGDVADLKTISLHDGTATLEIFLD